MALPRAAALLLLLACCASAAHGQRLLNRLACSAPPTTVTGLTAVGANGRIELSWNPSACPATVYRVKVERTDITSNMLDVTVSTPRTVVTNVANSTPYRATVIACNGAVCAPAATVMVTPSGTVQPIMPTVNGTTATTGSSAGAVAALPQRWTVSNVDVDALVQDAQSALRPAMQRARDMVAARRR